MGAVVAGPKGLATPLGRSDEVGQAAAVQAETSCHASGSSALRARRVEEGRSQSPRQVALQVGRFLLHLGEMVVAMQVGMEVFHRLLCATLSPYPVLHEAVMDLFMVVPMVAVMALHRHSWRHSAEMVGAMLAGPAVLFICLQVNSAAHLSWIPDQTLLSLSGITMYLGMLAAMLYRRDHYIGHLPVAHGIGLGTTQR
jgi:hypothetical protein